MTADLDDFREHGDDPGGVWKLKTYDIQVVLSSVVVVRVQAVDEEDARDQAMQFAKVGDVASWEPEVLTVERL